MGRVLAQKPIETKAFAAQGSALLDQLRGVQIVDEESFQLVANLGAFGKRIASAIEDKFAKPTKNADQLHKNLLRWKRETLDLFERVEKESKARMIEAHDKFPGYKPDGVIFSSVWRVEIEDPAAIPREFLIPDEKKIQGVATALGDECKIPGVKVFRRAQVSLRAGQ